MQYTLREIAERVGSAVTPETGAGTVITGVATLQEAQPGDISFLGSNQYLDQFDKTRAAAVIVKQGLKIPDDARVPYVLVKDVDLALGGVLHMFAPPVPHPPAGVDSSARIASSAIIGDAAAIGPNVVVGANSRIGKNTILHANVVIGDDVTIGDDCIFFPNVVVRERISIGHRVILHSGCELGSDGFGYRWNGKKHEKIPQIGTVIIEDDVELGACVCVDRAKLGSTRIGAGTKIDNLTQVAHNVQIGKHCIITAGGMLAGSAILEDGVVLGGQVAVRDHLHIGKGAMVGARSALVYDIPPGAIVSGQGFPHRQVLRELSALQRLPDLLAQVAQTERGNREAEAEIAAV